jgi:hypothetical protein
MSGLFDAGGLDPRAEVAFRELVLERLKVASVGRISRQLLVEAEIRTVMEMMADQLAVELSAHVLAHSTVRKQHRLVVEYPATAWDHVKATLARWTWQGGGVKVHGLRTEPHPAPRRLRRLVSWWLRRHPVRVTAEAVSVDFSEYATFPEAQIAYPKDLGRVVFAQTSSIEPNEAARTRGGRPEWPETRRPGPTDGDLVREIVATFARYPHALYALRATIMDERTRETWAEGDDPIFLRTEEWLHELQRRAEEVRRDA